MSYNTTGENSLAMSEEEPEDEYENDDNEDVPGNRGLF